MSDESRLREEICRYGRSLFERGLTPGSSGNISLRLPDGGWLVTPTNASLGFLPIGFPPIEGAIFYDMGVAWDSRSRVEFRERRAEENPAAVRVPLRSLGFSIRANMLGFLILRFDYAKPQNRPGTNAFWTVSLGPTF